MKETIKKRIRLAIRLKLFKNDKLILDTTKYIKSRILRLVQVNLWSKAYLKVSYGNGYYNDGIYKNSKDIKQVLSQFTEKSLVDSLKTKEN